MSTRDDLLQLRTLLEPLVESFEVDDPDTGLVAWIPVVGGTFVHPLSRDPIPKLKVYGAGPDRIKIAEPMFMRSLPTIPVLGLAHPSQLCAAVARMMGETLGELGRIRDAIAGMGINMDLEQDVLRLRGRVDLQGILVELVTSLPGELTVAALGTHPLSALEGQERVLKLSGQPTADLDELAKLVRRLDDHIRRETLEQMEQSLGLFGEADPAAASASPPDATPAPRTPGRPRPGPGSCRGRRSGCRPRDRRRSTGRRARARRSSRSRAARPGSPRRSSRAPWPSPRPLARAGASPRASDGPSPPRVRGRGPSAAPSRVSAARR